jgi:hypothetical protein
VIQSGGCDLDKAARKLRDSRMRGTEKRRVRKSTELLDYGGVDLWNAVAEKVTPQRRGTVEQPSAAIVYEVVPLCTIDNQRLSGEVFAHLSERMPHVVRIPAANIVRRRGLTPTNVIVRFH